MNKYLNKTQAEAVRDWWRGLNLDQIAESERQLKYYPFSTLGRKERAELRRCSSPEQVMWQRGFVLLAERLESLADKQDSVRVMNDPLAVALLAGLVAQVKKDLDDKVSFAAKLGQFKEGSDKPNYSELRFQRLQTSNDEDEFFQQTRRALAQISGAVDVVMLAQDVLAWFAEYRQGIDTEPKDRLRVRWASDYYRKRNKLPEQQDPDQPR